MAHDQKLEARVSQALKGTDDVKIKKMFGGICYMHRGNMLCGIDKNRLMVRVGTDQYASILKLKHAKVMDITGKPMKGFIFVYPEGLKTKANLEKWIRFGLKFTSTLSIKKTKKKISKNPKETS